MHPHGKSLFPAFLFLIVACASVPRVDLASEESAIRELDRQWAQAAARRDTAAFLGFYADDATLVMPNAPPAIGRAAIRSRTLELFALPNLSLSFEPTSISVARSGDLAYDLGSYRSSFDGPQGRVEDAGRYTTVWRKIDGRWRAVSDMVVSTNPPPPPPPPPAAPAVTVVAAERADMETLAGPSLAWNDLTVPGFKPGIKIAVIHGDPGGSGDYTIRLRFPDGYEVPAHWHPNAEHLTVLEGTFMLGMGQRMDRGALKSQRNGDFVYLPAQMPHFAIARGQTVIQLHGMGPFEVRMAEQAP